MARPTKLSTRITGRVCHFTRAGNYADTAASFAGIAKDTFYAWLKRAARCEEYGGDTEAARDTAEYDRWEASVEAWKEYFGWTPTTLDDAGNLKPKPEEPADVRAVGDAAWVAFSDAVEKAFAESELRDMMGITRHGQNSWLPLAWRRERMQPQKYGRRERVELTGAEGGPIDTRHTDALIVFHIPANGREEGEVPDLEDPWTGTPGEAIEAAAPAPPKQIGKSNGHANGRANGRTNGKRRKAG